MGLRASLGVLGQAFAEGGVVVHDGDPLGVELGRHGLGEELALRVVAAAGAEEVLEAALGQSHRSDAVADVHLLDFS